MSSPPTTIVSNNQAHDPPIGEFPLEQGAGRVLIYEDRLEEKRPQNRATSISAELKSISHRFDDYPHAGRHACVYSLGGGRYRWFCYQVREPLFAHGHTIHTNHCYCPNTCGPCFGEQVVLHPGLTMWTTLVNFYWHGNKPSKPIIAKRRVATIRQQQHCPP